MEEELVRATWGLVVATGLLVLAAAVPVAFQIAQARKRRIEDSARLVPNLLMVRSQLDWIVGRLAEPKAATQEEAADAAETCDDLLADIAGLLRQGTTLRVRNELFILRHLLTQAGIAANFAADLLFDDEEGETVRERDEKLGRVLHLAHAGRATVDAVLGLMPKKARTVSGEEFWTRFNRVSTDREHEAARALIGQGPPGGP